MQTTKNQKGNIIKKIPIPQSQAEWLTNRHELGIGGSEIGAVLGLNHYVSPLQVFYHKCRKAPIINPHRVETLWGHLHEPTIAKLWQYYEGTDDSILANYQNNKKIRKCQKVNAMFQNSKYDWLFANVDRIILKSAHTPRGILEIKTISGFVTRQYLNGIPSNYVMQVIAYMLVLELEYAEIAILEDGRYLKVYPIALEDCKNIVDKLLAQTKEFWQRVEEARKILVQNDLYDGDDISQEGIMAIGYLEPEIVGMISEQEFLKTQYRLDKENAITYGDAQDFKLLKDWVSVKDKIATLEKDETKYKNQIIHRFAQQEKLYFSESEYATFKENVKGHKSLKISTDLQAKLQQNE